MAARSQDIWTGCTLKMPEYLPQSIHFIEFHFLAPSCEVARKINSDNWSTLMSLNYYVRKQLVTEYTPLFYSRFFFSGSRGLSRDFSGVSNIPPLSMNTSSELAVTLSRLLASGYNSSAISENIILLILYCYCVGSELFNVAQFFRSVVWSKVYSHK